MDMSSIACPTILCCFFFQMVVVILSSLQQIGINVGNVPFHFCELPPWRIRRRRRLSSFASICVYCRVLDTTSPMMLFSSSSPLSFILSLLFCFLPSLVWLHVIVATTTPSNKHVVAIMVEEEEFQFLLLFS